MRHPAGITVAMCKGLGAIAAGLVPSPSIDTAATIRVDSLADTTGAGDGACTLREAITNANADSDTSGGDCAAGSGEDTITFSVSGTVTLGATLSPITAPEALTIDGTGQVVLISGNHAVRVLVVDSRLTLRQLTIANGNDSREGGGILNRGTLTVTNSTISDNLTGRDGGGIFRGSSPTSTAMLRNTIVANNSPVGRNCFTIPGGIQNGGYNLANDASCGFGTATGATGQTLGDNVDPRLAPQGLQSNGGPTQYHPGDVAGHRSLRADGG